MNPVKQKIIDEFHMLSAWDPRKKPSKWRKLINAAKNAREGNRHKSHSLCTDYENDRKLLDIFYVTSVLSTQSFTDEASPRGGYLMCGQDGSYAINTGKEFLVFDLYVECGSLLVCNYYKKLPAHRKHIKIYPIQYVQELLLHKLSIYQKHVDKLLEEQKEKSDRMKELQQVIASAATADALMNVIGLSMDTKSKKKISAWQREAEELEKELGTGNLVPPYRGDDWY